MTIYSLMETISISKLKAHLSDALKKVGKGTEYVVMDRSHPVARLIPFSGNLSITIQEPQNPGKIVQRRFAGSLDLDPVDILLQDRSREYR